MIFHQKFLSHTLKSRRCLCLLFLRIVFLRGDSSIFEDDVNRLDDLLSVRETTSLLPTLSHSTSRHRPLSLLGALDDPHPRKEAALLFTARRKAFRYGLKHERQPVHSAVVGFDEGELPTNFANWEAQERLRPNYHPNHKHRYRSELWRIYGDLNIAPRNVFRRGEYREVRLTSAIVGSEGWRRRLEADERRLQLLWQERSRHERITSATIADDDRDPPDLIVDEVVPAKKMLDKDDRADRLIASSLPLAVQVWGIGIFHKLHRKFVSQPDVPSLRLYNMFEHHNEADFVVLKLLFRKFREVFGDALCGATQKQHHARTASRSPPGVDEDDVASSAFNEEEQDPFPSPIALMAGVAGGDFVRAAHAECPGATIHGFEVQPVFRERVKLRFAEAYPKIQIHGVGWGSVEQEREVVGCGERATVLDVDNGQKSHFWLEAMARQRSALYGYKEVAGGAPAGGRERGEGETGAIASADDPLRRSEGVVGGGNGSSVAGVTTLTRALVTDGTQVQEMRDEVLSENELAQAVGYRTAANDSSIGRGGASFEIEFCTGRHLTLRQGRIKIQPIPKWCAETGNCGGSRGLLYLLIDIEDMTDILSQAVSQPLFLPPPHHGIKFTGRECRVVCCVSHLWGCYMWGGWQMGSSFSAILDMFYKSMVRVGLGMILRASVIWEWR